MLLTIRSKEEIRTHLLQNRRKFLPIENDYVLPWLEQYAGRFVELDEIIAGAVAMHVRSKPPKEHHALYILLFSPNKLNIIALALGLPDSMNEEFFQKMKAKLTDDDDRSSRAESEAQLAEVSS